MTKHGNVKNDKQYEALRKKGMSKQRAAKITNAGTRGSKKGGAARTPNHADARKPRADARRACAPRVRRITIPPTPMKPIYPIGDRALTWKAGIRMVFPVTRVTAPDLATTCRGRVKKLG